MMPQGSGAETAEGASSEAWVYLDLHARSVLAESSFRSWSSYLAAPAEPEPEPEDMPLAPDEDLPTR